MQVFAENKKAVPVFPETAIPRPISLLKKQKGLLVEDAASGD